MMEQKLTKRPIVVFNHDVNSEDLSMISTKFNGDIVVLGKLTVENIILRCNLYCQGDIVSSYIEVGGNVVCDGNIGSSNYSDCKEIKIGGTVTCKRDIYSANIAIEGDVTCEGDIDSDYIEIGGDVTAEETFFLLILQLVEM